MNMASTQPVHTTGTATCSWNESMCTTMRQQVKKKFTMLMFLSHWLSDFLKNKGTSGPLSRMLIPPPITVPRNGLDTFVPTPHDLFSRWQVCPSCSAGGFRARHNGLCQVWSLWTNLQTRQLCLW